MTSIKVAGGIYRERCTWPDWEFWYGSGGRAAAAVSGLADEVELFSYATEDAARQFGPAASLYGFKFIPTAAPQAVSFDYFHPMSVPIIRPAPGRIRALDPLEVSGSVVLRFGMIEGTAKVSADTCIYDPQSAFAPEAFHANGSRAGRLAIVANATEIATLTGHADVETGAGALLRDSGAEVVVAKGGARGALLIDASGPRRIPAFHSDSVWTIGSGDVFAAVFAAAWGAQESAPALLAASTIFLACSIIDPQNANTSS
jgi:hypothetical protein